MGDLRLSLPDLRVVNCSASRRQGFVLGRGSDCDVVVVDPRVSSRHLCVFPADPRGTAWFVSDLNSRHGVTINGARIAADTPTPIQDGDTIGAGPAIVRVIGDASKGHSAATHATLIDGPSSRVVAPASIVMGVAELQSLSRLGEARDREALFEELLKSVLDITGYGRGVIAQVADGAAAVDVLAQEHRDEGTGPIGTLSRSLVISALRGGVAVHDSASDMGAAGAASIVATDTHHACCVRLGDARSNETATFVLYLDSRGRETSPHKGSTDVAAAFASVAAACLARLNAADLEQRHAALHRELQNARAIQEQLHPPVSGTILGGLMRYHIVSLPGRTVAGDIVDVVHLPARDGRPERAALVIGDVMGKGAAAGMLMASIQSRLSQGLQDGVPLHELIGAINLDTSRRCPGIMASLWVGLLERADGDIAAGCSSLKLTYVDGGHGTCLRRSREGVVTPLNAGGGPVIGVGEGISYVEAAAILEPGDSLCLVTDGLPEQPNESGKQLGMEAVDLCFAAVPNGLDEGAQSAAMRLRLLLRDHSGTTSQRDDVTILCISIAL